MFALLVCFKFVTSVAVSLLQDICVHICIKLKGYHKLKCVNCYVSLKTRVQLPVVMDMAQSHQREQFLN